MYNVELNFEVDALLHVIYNLFTSYLILEMLLLASGFLVKTSAPRTGYWILNNKSKVTSVLCRKTPSHSEEKNLHAIFKIYV